MRVVLDTNVIVSAHLKPHGYIAQIFAAWHEEVFDVVVSDAILTEYEEVLLRPNIQKRHQLTSSQVKQTIEDIRELAILVQPTDIPEVVQDDPDDNTFLACGIAGRAEYIISSDPDLLDIQEFHGMHILTPMQFLEVLQHEHV